MEAAAASREHTSTTEISVNRVLPMRDRLLELSTRIKLSQLHMRQLHIDLRQTKPLDQSNDDARCTATPDRPSGKNHIQPRLTKQSAKSRTTTVNTRLKETGVPDVPSSSFTGGTRWIPLKQEYRTPGMPSGVRSQNSAASARLFKISVPLGASLTGKGQSHSY